jgi:hypothetical protein
MPVPTLGAAAILWFIIGSQYRRLLSGKRTSTQPTAIASAEKLAHRSGRGFAHAHEVRSRAPDSIWQSTLLLALAAPTLSLAQSLGAAPSWAQSMGPGTWAAISNNTIASVDPANDPAREPELPELARVGRELGGRCR